MSDPITNIMHEEAARQRHKYEKEAIELIKEIHAIQGRIYTVLHEDRDLEDKQRVVQNLVREVKRLETKFKKSRKQYQKLLEKQFALDEIGMPMFLTYSKLSESGANLLYDKDSAMKALQKVGASAPPKKEEKEEDEEDEEDVDLTLMRTKSTGTLEGQSPSSKWHSLFKMFKEWKHQTNIARGEHIAYQKAQEEKDLEEDIIKVRAAIQSLRQRKDPSKEDMELLAKLQARLRDLNEQLRRM